MGSRCRWDGFRVPIQVYFCFISSLAFALCITRIRARVNTNNISNTRDRVSIDAGLKSVEADRVLYFNSRRDK